MGKYFTVAELCKSPTAQRLGIYNEPNEPIRENLKLLIERVLDPLREAYGKPIIVTSGYRCDALNKAVKGSKTSQHMSGQAADVNGVSKADNRKLFELAQQLKLPFDQLIWEYGTKDCPDWVHLSYSPKHRRQILKLGVK